MLGVWWIQWKHDTGSLERICATGEEVVDGTWHVGEGLDGVQSVLIKDTGLVVVYNEDTTTGENIHEGIQVVRVGTIKPVQVLGVSSGWERKNLAGRSWGSVGTDLTTENKNGSIGHDHGRWVPATSEQRKLVVVLLPIVGSGNSRGSVWEVQANTICGSTSPATNVKLSSGLVWKSNTGGAEDIRLHVERSPGGGPITRVDQGEIKLIGTSGVGSSGTRLLHEDSLVVDTNGGNQRNDNTRDEELVRALCVTCGLVPSVERSSCPLVVGCSGTSTTVVVIVTGAGNLAVGLRLGG
jgi:hypothetical protein